MKRQSLVVLILLTIVIFLFSSMITAGSDELKSGLLEAILSQDKPGLFDDYRKLDLAKTTMKTLIQGMSGKEVTSTTKAWVDMSLGINNDFEVMVNLSKSSDPSDHLKAIEVADGLNMSINRLRGYDMAERNGIPMLSMLALTRFYRGEGKFFEEAARNTDETKVKIGYAQNSSIVYRKGGMTSEASRMEFEWRRHKRIYERDMKRALEYLNDARVLRDNAINPSSGFFGSDFMAILNAKDSFESAKGLYEKHNDTELENENVIKTEDAIIKTYQRLMLDTLLRILIYLLILSAITFILWTDFKRWGEELNDTRLGEELII